MKLRTLEETWLDHAISEHNCYIITAMLRHQEIKKRRTTKRRDAYF